MAESCGWSGSWSATAGSWLGGLMPVPLLVWQLAAQLHQIRAPHSEAETTAK
jgi:hypothetical protein